jgi:hypothetical protein
VSKNKFGGLKQSNAIMLPAMLLVQLGNRLGLGKQIAQFGLKLICRSLESAKAFRNYEPTEHDVFVATYAKSGTNWMMQISQQVSHRGEAEFEHIHTVVPWPDTPAPGPISLGDMSALEESPTGLRVIKTHLQAELVPYSEKSTYLTVLRDPKEVLISSYYFLGGMIGVLSHITIDDWYEFATSPGGLMDLWAVHTASFWNWRDRPNVLVLNYAEVKSEPRRSIERVASIMGVDLTESQLAKVIERASFEYMKAHESQFAPPQPPFGDESNPTLMVRRGASGQSGELLSLAQQAELDRLCQAKLRELGSDFPYATEFEVVPAS